MEVIQIGSQKRSPATDAQKEEVKAKIKKMQKEGSKLIRGMFEFVDAQGGWFDFNYRFYPGEAVTKVKIIHGEICDIPTDLAKHLNNVYKKIRMLPDNLDKGAQKVTKISRTRFIPMEMLA